MATEAVERITDNAVDQNNGRGFGLDQEGNEPLEIFSDVEPEESNDRTGAFEGPAGAQPAAVPPPGQETPAPGPSPSGAAPPAAPAVPPPGQPPAPGEAPTAEQQQALLAGRFQDVGALEAGYVGLQQYTGRLQNERDQSQQQLRQAMELLQRAAPALAAYEQIQQGGGVAPPGAPASAPSPALAQLAESLGLEGDAATGLQQAIAAEAQRQAQAMVQQMLPQALGPMAQRIEQGEVTANQRAYEAARMAVVSDFSRAHPEVTEGSPLENVIGEHLQYWPGLSLADRDALEFAYQLATVPALSQVAADPRTAGWTASPEGRAALRAQVGLQTFAPVPGVPVNGTPAAAGPVAAPAGRQAPPTAAARARTFVETGGKGAPAAAAPGAPTSDEVSEMIEAYESKQRGASPLFGHR